MPTRFYARSSKSAAYKVAVFGKVVGSPTYSGKKFSFSFYAGAKARQVVEEVFKRAHAARPADMRGILCGSGVEGKLLRSFPFAFCAPGRIKSAKSLLLLRLSRGVKFTREGKGKCKNGQKCQSLFLFSVHVCQVCLQAKMQLPKKQQAG